MWIYRHMWRQPCADGGRDWSHKATGQEHQGRMQAQELAKAGRVTPWSLRREHSSANALVSDCWPQNWERRKFCWDSWPVLFRQPREINPCSPFCWDNNQRRNRLQNPKKHLSDMLLEKATQSMQIKGGSGSHQDVWALVPSGAVDHTGDWQPQASVV